MARPLKCVRPCAVQLSCPKALVLAGTDRLDRALTIGQMQVRDSRRPIGPQPACAPLPT